MNVSQYAVPGAMVVVAVITVIGTRLGKRTREAVSFDKLWARLDAQDATTATLRNAVTSLQDDVAVYRGAFRALWGWHERVHDTWDCASPVPDFTAEERQAVDRAVHANETHEKEST